MARASGWIDYEERLARVTAHIYEHLDEEIDLQRLADIACLSPYHWHRIYHALYGETIAAAVKRLRLHRAAGYLANTRMPVGLVAARSGYANVQSFTRIFKSVYGMPPAQFRQQGSHTQFQAQPQGGDALSYSVEVRPVASLTALSVAHAGSYMGIGRAFDALYARLGARNLLRPGMRSIAVYYDDPSAVAENALRSRACVIADGPAEVPGLDAIAIAGGTCAVLRHKGPYADMKAAYRWLYGHWLVESGREAADAPVLEEYLNSPRDTAPTDLMTDIHLPLRQHTARMPS